MSEISNQKKALKKMLAEGQIDQSSYEQQMAKLNYTKRMNFHEKTKIIRFLLIIAIIGCAIWFLLTYNNVEKKYENVESYDNLPGPVMSDASGSITKKVWTDQVELEYVVDYSIMGRVINVQKYIPYSLKNRLSPRSIGLAWGFMATDEYVDKSTWSSTGNRVLYWHASDKDNDSWVKEIGGEDYIEQYYSNYQIIPADKTVKSLINKIKVDDYVKLEGYIVNASYKVRGNDIFWESGATDADTGDFTGDILYTTNVVWLNEGDIELE